MMTILRVMVQIKIIFRSRILDMYIDHISVRISHTKTSTSDEHIVFDDRGNLQHTRPPRLQLKISTSM